MKTLSAQQRKRSGGMLPLVIVCLGVLIAIVVAAFSLSMIFSGEQKVRSVVDAGALALAERAPERKITPNGLFADCADSEGKIGIMNVNRVIGKAMLINMNAEAMKKEGQAGNCCASADIAEKGAEQVESDVKDKLLDTKGSKMIFMVVAPKKTTEVEAAAPASGGGGAPAEPQFDSSLVHRGSESNLDFDKGQFPGDVQLPSDAIVQAGKDYVAGYKPIKANGREFYFLPFRQKELPHLIPSEEFRDNKAENNPLAWASPIPNAYQVTANGGIAPNMVSVASAVANPQTSYDLAIPHAYVVISLSPTAVTWKVDGKTAGSTKYDFEKEQQNGVKKFPVPCGKVDGFASLGNEYKQQDLFHIMTEAVPGDHEKMMNKLLQRVKEIDKDYTRDKLEALLKGQQFRKNEYSYLIYPEYTSRDNTSPKIKIDTRSAAASGWLDKNAIADGGETQIGTEQLEDAPNSSWAVPIGTWKLTKAKVKINGKITWTPATGVSQILGVVRIERTCEVTLDGKCQ